MSTRASHSTRQAGGATAGLCRELRSLPRGVWVLAGGSFTNSFGVLVLPFLTLYLVRRGYTPGEAGTTVLLYGLGKLAAAPAGGYLADRIGPRRATALSMFSSAASMLAVLIRLLVALTLTNVLLFQAQTTLPLWIRDLGFSSTVYGALLALNGGLNATLQLPVSALSTRFARHRAIAAGCALIAVGFAVTGLVHTVFLLSAAVLVWTLGELINWPVGAAYVASLAPRELAVRYAGARSFTFALGLVLAPIIGIPLLTWTPVALSTFCLLAGLLAMTLTVTLRPAVTSDRATTALTPNPAAQAAGNRSAST